ncbi:MAG: hypothetical protein PWP23_774 [Candidatus Sumerlaeota bacterium]|nr:hypothetical protein [Candidatus Sumerlaeota bacterium]
MAQVNEFLKPVPPSTPARPSSGGGDGGDDRERDRLNYPKAPVAGFWRRLGALLFDYVLLYFVFIGIGKLLHEPLFALGRHSSALGAVVVLLYFTLANGPVGKGRTVGKFLVGIRVRDYRGEVPSLGRSAARTVLLFPGILAAFFVSPFVFDYDTYKGLVYGNMLSGYVTFALFLGMVIAIVFNPFKQGMHDYLAKTTVQPGKGEPLAFEKIAEIIGGQWQRFHRQAMINGSATFGLLLVLLTVLSLQQLKGEKGGALYETERSLLKETFDPNVVLTMRVFPLGADPDDPAGTFTPEIAESFYASLYDQASTETMKVVLVLQRKGRWPQNLDDPTFREKIEGFATRYREDVFGTLPGEAIYPLHREEGEPVQLTKRPLVFDVRIDEALYLFFARPAYHSNAGKLEMRFPPLDESGMAVDSALEEEGPEAGSG